MWRREWLGPSVVAAVAAIAITISVWHMQFASKNVSIERIVTDGIPATIFRPAALAEGERAPVAIIAHGFAGSQQLMQPFALTLASNGIAAITFDFPGHGRNALPMSGGMDDYPTAQRTLLDSLDSIRNVAKSITGEQGGYAVIGHSMASDLVVRHAQAHRDVKATIGVSLYAPTISAESPPDSPSNLLVIAGAWEPAFIASEALRVIVSDANAAPALSTTYGDFNEGTARRAVLSPDVEHISVLFSATTQRESLAWLQASFGETGPIVPFVDARGPWIALLLAGLVALGWPLSRLLPRGLTGGPPAPAGSDSLPDIGIPGNSAPGDWRVLKVRRTWRHEWLLALLPALLTPLILWQVSTSDLMPILLGDYLVLHFGLYGWLTIATLAWARRRAPEVGWLKTRTFWLAAIGMSVYTSLVIGLALDTYIFNLAPIPVRRPIIAVMLVGMLLYFVADEWHTRGADAAPAAYLITKISFLLSLTLAIALNPAKLAFLAIIVPAILLMFIAYGLFSRWAFHQTRNPFVAALANAVAFAWFTAVTFPLVA